MSQYLQFCKMHGLGNDFILIDAINQTVSIDKTWIRQMADRHLGIGFDQLLLIEKSHQADFACRIYNADGSEAEQCGNGIRCVARFIHEENLSNLKSLSIETKAGIIAVVIHHFDNIQVNMGVPIFEPKKIPFIAEKQQPLYLIPVENTSTALEFSALSMGNPHAILRIPAIKHFPVEDIVQKLTHHALFPQGVNIGFVEVIDRQHVRLRTIERGVGETFACGTNACAAVVAGMMNDWLDNNVTVHLKYGNLYIEWAGQNQPVMMTGPAARVFAGSV